MRKPLSDAELCYRSIAREAEYQHDWSLAAVYRRLEDQARVAACPDHGQARPMGGICPACNATSMDSPVLRACTCAVTCSQCGWSWSPERYQELQRVGGFCATPHV